MPNFDGNIDAAVEQVLGYLNFSSGADDPRLLLGLHEIYGAIGSVCESVRSTRQTVDVPAWRSVVERLDESLDALRRDAAAFSDISQARSVLGLARDYVIPGYRNFHHDLLFHQSDDTLFNPFMLGRMFQLILKHRNPEDDANRIADKVIGSLNDFIGHRPIPTLETQKIEPRPHEWVRPIPLYIEGAGVCHGPYQELVSLALELLRGTDPALLKLAYFDPVLLEELAVDPRSYDFDHPANRRPNYHFGEWDPNQIDNRGFYRRFVIREVNLRALMQRVERHDYAVEQSPPREELLWEAAAVLAGTILMASGISGCGPDSHDSNTTLMTLITRIAAYRDVYYEQIVGKLTGKMKTRLKKEAKRLRQPLGGARQHLNTELSRQRATQLSHVRLAKVFAKMGYIEAAQRQVDAVRVTSARMLCRIDCAITAGHQATRRHDQAEALKQLDRIVDLLHRGINCGAIVDPWNILGFDANYSLFPATENSVRDHRVDDLITTMDRVFDLYARLWSDAAATDSQAMASRIESRYEETASWWHRFAAHEVSSVSATPALSELEAARQVTEALNRWHREGAATGDVRFWAPYVENFDSPKAYALVIETLLGNDDYLSSMSLLIHWLGQAPRVALEANESSFHQIALRWVRSVVSAGFHRFPTEKTPSVEGDSMPVEDAWRLLKRFFDFIEPNAEEYWEPPHFELANESRKSRGTPSSRDADDEGPESEASEDLFQAAYEGVTFQDSTDDGVDGFVFDTSSQTNEELEREAERIIDRLAFLDGLARFWTTTGISVGTAGESLRKYQPIESLRTWYARARHNREQLFELLQEVSEETIPRPSGNHESMVDYDRHRLIKDSLLEQIISTIVEISQAERFLLAAVIAHGGDPPALDESADEITSEMARCSELLAASLRRDRVAAATICDDLLDELPARQILYVPLAKSGSGSAIATVRMRQRIIENLLVALPRLGLLAHTIDLIDTAREMEFNVPAGRGPVTQFDELFDVGFRELVKCLVRTTDADQSAEGADGLLIECLEQLTESVLRSWLEHSRTLRLSVLERVRGKEAWEELVAFIQQHGGDIFTQRFFGLGNIRAILHCGVDNWLKQIEESGVDPPFALMEQLDRSIPRDKAVDMLTLVLEAVVEGFEEYRDYNSSTTQSDQGEMLFMFLDFLRLQSAYDRVAWNLKPVVTSHEILVRSGRNDAAQLWRRALSDRVGEEADRYQKRLARLQSKYAMRMASVADRIGERFLRPMTIDRMRALVRPAIEQLGASEPSHVFELLEEETALLMREPSGSGLDVPLWLAALEEEIENLRPWSPLDWNSMDDELLMAPYELRLEDLLEQLREL